MSSIYARGSRLWMRVKIDGAWTSKPTPFSVGHEPEAKRYAARAQENLDRTAKAAARVDATQSLLAMFSRANLPSTKTGWVYVIALTPEVDLRRMKIGWTTKPVARRLKTYRTTNPHAALLGLWDADSSDEERAHRLADGRLGKSEVFICADTRALLERLDVMLMRSAT